MEVIYVGAADIAGGKVGTLRNPDNRKKYERAYRDDFRHYGGELTPEKANQKLQSLREFREFLLKRRRERGIHKAYSKDAILKTAAFLLDAKGVDEELLIDNPIELGGMAEVLYGEKLPTIRLWIRFEHYVIGVVPDGVADDYAYEFKATTLAGHEAEEVRDQAIRQAQLYAYAFKRPNIKVQVAQFKLSKHAFPIRVKDLPKPDLATISRPASEDGALAILRDFDHAFRGLQKF